jgi:hypothetical protein
VLLDLPRANPRQAQDHVVFAVQLPRERSVDSYLGQSILLTASVRPLKSV